tara:strand:+ start:292 stop:1011 length:720 start_codon:yes stop_codon:yes gene_type:complete
MNNSKESSKSDYHGKRRLSIGRKIYYFLGKPILLVTIYTLISTCKIRVVDKNNSIEKLVKNTGVFAPCFWHQDLLITLLIVSRWLKKGFKGGFIISPSVDGEVPAQIAKSWGAEIIRGSAVRTGASAMRDIHHFLKRGVSIVTAADGPLGPKFQFKMGVVLMAKLGDAPIIPITCSCSNAWYLNRWDHFMIPKPFTKIVVMIGRPYDIPKTSNMSELEEHRNNIELKLNEQKSSSEKLL